MRQVAVRLGAFCAGLAATVGGHSTAAPERLADAIGYGPLARYSGVYELGFEQSLFRGCWLTFRGKAGDRFLKDNRDAFMTVGPLSRFRLTIIGRRTDRPTPTGGYGHMSASPCQIEAERIIKVRRLGAAR